MSTSWPEVYPVEIPGKLPICFECSIPGCGWRTYHRNADSAHKERESHAINTCPMEVQIDMSIISELWDEVDSVVDDLSAAGRDKTDPSYLKSQGKAQGIAIAIYLMSRPHFADPQAVAKHAGARHKAKVNQEDVPDTPGCAGFNPLPATVERNKVRAEVNKVKAAEAQAGNVSSVPDEVRKMIVNANAAKLPITSIMKLTKLSKEQIETVISLDGKLEKIDAS